MLNKTTLSKMKKGSYLVNTARGPVVSEHDLVEALRSGQLAGVGLDVYDNEPNIDPELIGMENVILTPHIGTATIKTRMLMGEIVSKNIIAAINGEIPPNIVNKWGYKK